MKLAIVVQRYGADINGGAELHARYIAEHLARHAQVDVLTTCARDYVTWRNELPAGDEQVNGIRVRRFPVRRPRDVVEFGRQSQHVFDAPHSLAEELAWLESEGPASPALISHLSRVSGDYDFSLFFSYRYYHAYHGIRAVPERAVLVPTAERDPAVGLAMFGPVFRGVRAVMYNSFEERAMIQTVASNESIPGVVVGVGSEVPARVDGERFRRAHGIRGPFALYIGRIDENKGCGELLGHFQRYAAGVSRDLQLVLIGGGTLGVPDHPRIRHLGFLADADKFDGLAAADALIMPSYFESLSMVTLEAWALGKPVLANAHCDVLQGQCLRSNAGLFYENYEEFAETLRALETNPSLRGALGANGREYFRRHYAWPVIERRYLDMLERLQRDTGAPRREMEPLPGWFARRRRNLPAARAVLDTLPRGAARSGRAPAPRQSPPQRQREA